MNEPPRKPRVAAAAGSAGTPRQADVKSDYPRDKGNDSVFQSVRQARLADVIADQLRKLILEGTLRPGTRMLTERELAERFDSSRPTVREAVKQLEREGLLSMQRGGMHVADPAAPSLAEPLSALLMSDPQGVEDFMEFRQIMEGAAAYLAASRGNEVDRGVLHRAFARIEAAQEKGDVDEEAEADAEFHLAIYESSHNSTILHVMRSISTILRNYTSENRHRLYDRRGYREFTIAQHRAIYEAITSGDGEKAKQEAQSHIFLARQAMAEARKADERLELSIRRLKNQVGDIDDLVGPSAGLSFLDRK